MPGSGLSLGVSHPRRTALGAACGAGAGALWGLVFLAPELVRDFSPLHLTAGRYLAYGLLSWLLLVPSWPSTKAQLGRVEFRALLVLALVGNLIYYALLATAVQTGGIAMTSLVIGFLPVVVTVIGSREAGAVTLRRLLPSLVLSLAGTLCIGWQAFSIPSPEMRWRFLLGFASAVGALLSWTWFAIANRRWLLRLDKLAPQTWNLLTGVATALWASLLAPLLWLLGATPRSSTQWLRLGAVSLGVAFLASIVGNALWNRMSRLLPLTLVGQMVLFETIFALLYGFLWEHRFPTSWETLAFLLVCSSVVACFRAHQS